MGKSKYKKLKLEMVACDKCHKILPGNWTTPFWCVECKDDTPKYQRGLIPKE